MVRLHVVDHEVVEAAPLQLVGEVFEEHAVNGLVHGVKEHRLLVEQQVRVIGNAVGNAVNPLKAGKPPVVRADPDQVIGDFSRAMHR